jgi:hypothetical protein
MARTKTPPAKTVKTAPLSDDEKKCWKIAEKKFIEMRDKPRKPLMDREGFKRMIEATKCFTRKELSTLLIKKKK